MKYGSPNTEKRIRRRKHKKDDKHMDVTPYKGSEEYRISVMPESGKYLIYTPEECDEDGAPIDGAPLAGCDAIEEVNDLIAELMVDRELSFVPEDL